MLLSSDNIQSRPRTHNRHRGSPKATMHTTFLKPEAAPPTALRYSSDETCLLFVEEEDFVKSARMSALEDAESPIEVNQMPICGVADKQDGAEYGENMCLQRDISCFR